MGTLKDLPAFCRSCGAVFADSGYCIGENSTDISFQNCMAGFCSRCGGTCYVLDGSYSFIDNILEILVPSKQTVTDLLKLNNILIGAKKEHLSQEEVVKKIEQQLPAFHSLRQYWPSNPQEFSSYLALIISLLQLLISMNQTSTKVENTYITNYNININQVIHQSESISLTQSNIAPKKVGRNETCFCGSGKKYKKCCGQ